MEAKAGRETARAVLGADRPPSSAVRPRTATGAEGGGEGVAGVDVAAAVVPTRVGRGAATGIGVGVGRSPRARPARAGRTCLSCFGRRHRDTVAPHVPPESGFAWARHPARGAPRSPVAGAPAVAPPLTTPPLPVVVRGVRAFRGPVPHSCHAPAGQRARPRHLDARARRADTPRDGPTPLAGVTRRLARETWSKSAMVGPVGAVLRPARPCDLGVGPPTAIAATAVLARRLARRGRGKARGCGRARPL